MSDELIIPSNIIQKLGHNILEIRERALFALISKLDNGFVFDNELSRSKETLTKLFEWFLYNPCPHEETVLSLIKRILETESGRKLVQHYGPNTMKTDLKQVHSCLEPKYHGFMEELFEIVDKLTEFVEIPPLVSDMPLSYRSEHAFNTSRSADYIPNVEKTASSIVGYVSKDTSVEPKAGNISGTLNQSTYHVDREVTADPEIHYNLSEVLPNHSFKWQPLIDADRHVLQSVASSLRTPPQPSVLLHSCEFFTDVLLHDFPAELFLQRPAIILDLLATSTSTRVSTSVLNCLLSLTKSLQQRINHSNDPCMHNLKVYTLTVSSSTCSSPISSLEKSQETSSEVIENPEDTNLLRQFEMSTQRYCCTIMKSVFKYLLIKPQTMGETVRKKNQSGTNTAMMLIEELLHLLKQCFNTKIWNCQPAGLIYDALKDFNDLLIAFAEVLENYRIEVSANDRNVDFRALHLCLLHNCSYLLKNFITPDKCNYVLPGQFKTAIAHCLLDIVLAKLYPAVHNIFLDYVQIFSNEHCTAFLGKFTQVKNICESMSAAVKFMKKPDQSSTFVTISLAKEGLLSLQFHQDLKFVRIFGEVCASRFPMYVNESSTNTVEDVTLRLLSHHLEDVREEMYRVCHKIVIEAVGPRLNSTCNNVPGAQILFLLRAKIFIEISAYGVTSSNLKIKKYSEEILIHLLKCKILVTAEIWKQLLEALVISFPVMLIHASKVSILGRTLTNIIDPDTATDMLIPTVEVIKANIAILFSDESHAREEAFSRLCWMLSLQPDAKTFLPRLNNVNDKALPNVCQVSKSAVDINKMRHSDHFYQPSSLHQVMDLLTSPNVEPAIRRSALTQISVMLEDNLLHELFLEREGIEIVLSVMSKALVEENYLNYPDSVIPAISILKNLCLYNPGVRHELSTHLNLYYYILRGLFLYCTEERLKLDSSCLLFLLLYSCVITGSPSRANMAVLAFVNQELRVPFICDTYGKNSQYHQENLIGVISEDKLCKSCIQIHWNAELFEGFYNLLKLDNVNYEEENIKINDLLKIQYYDFISLKVSSVDQSITNCLSEIQKVSSHGRVNDAVQCLTTYVYLHSLCKIDKDFSILFYPWELTFEKFLKELPSGEEDINLLHGILKFLILLVPFYKTSEKPCWIVDILKDRSQCLLDLLSIEYSMDENMKVLSREILNLITACVSQEQHYLDFYVDPQNENLTPFAPMSWAGIIELVANNLKFNDSQHFYNLAFLDSLLSCLVNLSATLGWSSAKPRRTPRQSLKQIVGGLCELVEAFHHGKGPSAAVSVMGLSITRNVVLILNHILAEMQNSNIKSWDLFFVGHDSETNKIYNFIELWSTRDVVLRAAVVQLFAGLVVSPRLSVEIVHALIHGKKCLWSMALNLVFDHEEASIVRENAVLVLANLVSHTCNLSDGRLVLIHNVGPVDFEKGKPMHSINSILNLLKNFDSTKQFKTILYCLYTNNLTSAKVDHEKPEISSSPCPTPGYSYSYRTVANASERSWNSAMDNSSQLNITTPSFVKGLIIFLFNLIALSDEKYLEELNDAGLIKLIFRTMCYPCLSIRNTRELALYCELLEMDAVICSFLNKCVKMSQHCLGTILHTKDCVNVLLSFLSSKMYQTYLPQLYYLRNKLWSELFYLIATFLECSGLTGGTKRSLQVVNIILESIHLCGPANFLEAVCESIGSIGSCELQSAALTSLTMLLQVETLRITPEENPDAKPSNLKKYSMRNLLDNVKAPKAFVIDNENDKDEEININQPHRSKSFNKHKMNVLEYLYFGDVVKKSSKGDVSTVSETTIQNTTLLAGAEVCKILLHLYEMSDLKIKKDTGQKYSIFSAISAILCVSNEAKYYALDSGFLHITVQHLRDIHVKLSVESAESLRRVLDKKRISPLLRDLTSLTGLLTNFLLENVSVKCEAVALGLADIIHKLWNWFLAQKSNLVDILRLLSTFTTNCPYACQSLPFTSPMAGTGPRKVPSNMSLLHAIVTLVGREMDMLSKTHDIITLRLCFNILENCCGVLECRVCIAKSNILQGMLRLHPAITKRQKPWETVEVIWLEFLQMFTIYAEGQTYVGKMPDILDLIMAISTNSKPLSRQVALLVLQNIAFYTPNRVRLLSTDDFISILKSKLENGSTKEKNIVVTIMWALAANNTKAKSVFKAAQLDVRLQEVLKKYQVFSDGAVTNEDLERMHYVLNILRDSEKCR